MEYQVLKHYSRVNDLGTTLDLGYAELRISTSCLGDPKAFLYTGHSDLSLATRNAPWADVLVWTIGLPPSARDLADAHQVLVDLIEVALACDAGWVHQFMKQGLNSLYSKV